MKLNTGGTTALKYSPSKDALQHFLLTLAARNHRHITGCPTIRLWRASRTWGVKPWSRWHGAIWLRTTLLNGNCHVTITNVAMIMQHAAHLIPLLVRQPCAVWPDTVSGLVPRYTSNVAVINAVPAQHTNCCYSEAMVGVLPGQPCFLRDDFHEIGYAVFANWTSHIPNPSFIEVHIWLLEKKLLNLHVVLTSRFWRFFLRTILSTLFIHSWFLSFIRLPQTLMIFFQFI